SLLSIRSIHDEEFGARRRVGAMGLGVVGDLVAHSRGEDVGGATLQLDVELAFQAEEDVAFGAPVIRQIAGGVVDPSDAEFAEGPGAPEGGARLSGMLGRFDLRPVGRAEGDGGHSHGMAPGRWSRSYRGRPLSPPGAEEAPEAVHWKYPFTSRMTWAEPPAE